MGLNVVWFFLWWLNFDEAEKFWVNEIEKGIL